MPSLSSFPLTRHCFSGCCCLEHPCCCSACRHHRHDRCRQSSLDRFEKYCERNQRPVRISRSAIGPRCSSPLTIRFFKTWCTNAGPQLPIFAAEGDHWAVHCFVWHAGFAAIAWCWTRSHRDAVFHCLGGVPRNVDIWWARFPRSILKLRNVGMVVFWKYN